MDVVHLAVYKDTRRFDHGSFLVLVCQLIYVTVGSCLVPSVGGGAITALAIVFLTLYSSWMSPPLTVSVMPGQWSSYSQVVFTTTTNKRRLSLLLSIQFLLSCPDAGTEL